MIEMLKELMGVDTLNQFVVAAESYFKARREIEEGGCKKSVQTYYVAEESLQSGLYLLADILITSLGDVNWIDRNAAIEYLVDVAWARTDIAPEPGKALEFFAEAMTYRRRDLVENFIGEDE